VSLDKEEAEYLKALMPFDREFLRKARDGVIEHYRFMVPKH